MNLQDSEGHSRKNARTDEEYRRTPVPIGTMLAKPRGSHIRAASIELSGL
jgi:hypothetical protein